MSSTGWPTKISLFFFGNNLYNIKETFKIFPSRRHLISQTEHLNTSGITYHERLISCQTDNPWSSYSEDLNPPGYFLRGYLKDRVCEKNPQTIKDIIRKEIKRIPQEMLNRVVVNFNVRVAAVLSYNSAVHGTNIVLITEKV